MESQGENVTIRNKSELIEAFVKAGRLNVANQLVLELVKTGAYPLPRIFRYFMKSLAAAGDHESIRVVGEYLSTVSLLSDACLISLFQNCFVLLLIGKKEPT